MRKLILQKKTWTQLHNMKKLKSKVLKKTFYKIYGITLRKYLTANLPSSNHLQNELKTKDKIIDQLLKSFGSLTNSELKKKKKTSYINYLIKQMTKKRKNRYNVRMTSTLNLTLLITNLMKNIASRKLKNTLKGTKQIIHRITLNQKQ